MLVAVIYLIFASTTVWSKDRNSPSTGLVMEFSASYDDALSRTAKRSCRIKRFMAHICFDREKDAYRSSDGRLDTVCLTGWEGSGESLLQKFAQG